MTAHEQRPRIIRLTDPLPCGILNAIDTCGKPAHVAHAYEHEALVGYWMLLPVCKSCALAAAAVYDSNTHDPE
ncbi:hypothetical protein ES703_79209 [subsurface metagenome]